MYPANIKHANLETLLASTNQSKLPPSFLIKKQPGTGVLHLLGTMYPDAELVVIDDMFEQHDANIIAHLLTVVERNVGKMIIIDLDVQHCVLSTEVCCLILLHFTKGGRFIMATSGTVEINCQPLQNRMFTIDVH